MPDLDRYRDEMQAALDRAREYAEANVESRWAARLIPFDSHSATAVDSSLRKLRTVL